MLTQEQLGYASEFTLNYYLDAKRGLAGAKAALAKAADDPDDDGEIHLYCRDTVEEYEFVIEAFEQVVNG